MVMQTGDLETRAEGKMNAMTGELRRILVKTAEQKVAGTAYEKVTKSRHIFI